MGNYVIENPSDLGNYVIADNLPAWGLRLAAAPRPADLEKLRHSAACRLTGVTGSAE